MSIGWARGSVRGPAMHPALSLIAAFAFLTTNLVAQDADSVEIRLPDVVVAGSTIDVEFVGKPGQAFDVVVDNDSTFGNERLPDLRVVLDGEGRMVVSVEVPSRWKGLKVKGGGDSRSRVVVQPGPTNPLVTNGDKQRAT